MKKNFIVNIFIISVFLTFITLYSTAYSAENGTLSVSSTNGNVEDEISVTISVTDNPGIATFSLNLNFDKTKLLPVSITKGSALTVGDITSNIQSGSNLDTLDFVSAFWVNASNITSNGELYTVKFKIKEGAFGTIPITLTYNTGDVANQAFEDITLQIINGTVNVNDSNEPTATITATKPNSENEIDVTVSITNNPGIAAFSLNLNFDKTKLLPISITKGSALTVGDITSNIQSGSNLDTLDFVSAFWVNASNITSDGELYIVKFKIKEAASKTTAFNITYEAGDISNQAFEDIQLKTIDTTIQLSDTLPFVTTIASKELIKQNNEITGSLSLTVTNNTQEVRLATISVAIYDAEGILVYLSSKNNAQLNTSDNTITYSGINITNAVSTKYTIKAFVWDSVNSLEPLAYAETAEIK